MKLSSTRMRSVRTIPDAFPGAGKLKHGKFGIPGCRGVCIGILFGSRIGWRANRMEMESNYYIFRMDYSNGITKHFEQNFLQHSDAQTSQITWVSMIGYAEFIVEINISSFFVIPRAVGSEYLRSCGGTLLWELRAGLVTGPVGRIWLFSTPPKCNIDPEKWWLEDYFPIGKVTFPGLC